MHDQACDGAVNMAGKTNSVVDLMQNNNPKDDAISRVLCVSQCIYHVEACHPWALPGHPFSGPISTHGCIAFNS